jgi:hypothetical protein
VGREREGVPGTCVEVCIVGWNLCPCAIVICRCSLLCAFRISESRKPMSLFPDSCGLRISHFLPRATTTTITTTTTIVIIIINYNDMRTTIACQYCRYRSRRNSHLPSIACLTYVLP